MKRIFGGLVVMCLALSIALYLSAIIKASFVFSEQETEASIDTKDENFYRIAENDSPSKNFRVTWQDEDASCGKLVRNPFTDEYMNVDNPLCSYSADLHEIPTVGYSELSRVPKLYNQKIVRVRGRIQLERNDTNLSGSRLYMMSEDSPTEYPVEFNNPWSDKLNAKLYKFIQASNSEINSVSVDLIITFYYLADDPDILAITNNNPLQMIVLDVEDMNPLPSAKEKRKK